MYRIKNYENTHIGTCLLGTTVYPKVRTHWARLAFPVLRKPNWTHSQMIQRLLLMIISNGPAHPMMNLVTVISETRNVMLPKTLKCSFKWQWMPSREGKRLLFKIYQLTACVLLQIIYWIPGSQIIFNLIFQQCQIPIEMANLILRKYQYFHIVRFRRKAWHTTNRNRASIRKDSCSANTEKLQRRET